MWLWPTRGSATTLLSSMADRVIAVAFIPLTATALSGCRPGRRGHRRIGSESRVRILGRLSQGRWEKLLFPVARRRPRPQGLPQTSLTAWPPTEAQGRQVYAGSRKNLGYDVTSLVTVTRRSLCGCGKEPFERRWRKYGS